METLGPQAFDDLLDEVLHDRSSLRPRFVWALALCSERHERLLPLLREWLPSSSGNLRMQIATSIAHVLTERRMKGQLVDDADVALFKAVLIPEATPGTRLTLREFDRASAGAG